MTAYQFRASLALVTLVCAAAALILLWPADPPPRAAGIAEIEASIETVPTLLRLQEDPDILVLDFPTLHPQAQMLNRVAALIEKAGMPRDRILSEAELDASITEAGGTPDSFYYGHDYSAADLARFFALAAAQAMPLNPSETWLKARLAAVGWLRQGAVGALLSLPGVGGDIDAAARAAIFRHELSHGVYCAGPAYVALTHRWWSATLSETEREAIRRFLGAEGYDTDNMALMENEAQAFFIHTRDPRFFKPALIGIGPARDEILRGSFIGAIPEPWLRASALHVAPVSAAASLAP